MPLKYNVATAPEDRRKHKIRLVKPVSTTEEVPPLLPTSKVPEAVSTGAMPPPPPPPALRAAPPMYGVQAQPAADPLSQVPPATPPGMAAIAPSAVAQEPVNTDPYGIQRAWQAYQAANAAPVKKSSRLKAFGKMMAYALGQTQPGVTWYDVASQVGQGLGGGVAGIIQPKLPGAVSKLYDVQQKEADLERAQKYAQVASLANYRDIGLDLRGEELKLKREVAKINADYKAWAITRGDRTATDRENRTKFAQEYMKNKQASVEAMNAWHQNYAERQLAERIRATDLQHYDREQLRALTLQTLGLKQKRSDNTEEANLAGDLAYAEALLNAADEIGTTYRSFIEGLKAQGEEASEEDLSYLRMLQAKQLQLRAEGRGLKAEAETKMQKRGVAQPSPSGDTMSMKGMTLEDAVNEAKRSGRPFMVGAFKQRYPTLDVRPYVQAMRAAGVPIIE